MQAKAMNFASSSAPWRKGASWGLVIAEGAVLAAVGLYALLAPENARETVFAVFGALLAVNGAGAAMTAFRSEPSRSTSFLAFRGGIGLACGILALIARFTDAFSSDSARVILGSGFLIVGVVALAHQFLVRDEVGFRLGTLAWNVVIILFAILLFTGSDDDDSRLTLLGWALIILGALLAAFGYYLKTRLSTEGGAPSPAGESVYVADTVEGSTTGTVTTTSVNEATAPPIDTP